MSLVATASQGPTGPLENIARTVATSERWAARYRARAVMRDIRPRVRKEIPNKYSAFGLVEANVLPRLSYCGLSLGEEVRLRGQEGSAGVAGLASCGSVWACPVCASKVAMTRTGDLEAGIRHWAGHGGSFAMLTLTIQHRAGQSLSDLWDAVSAAWRRFVRDGTATRKRKSLGVEGFHRTTEVTYGVNGWHVHLHVLYFLSGSVSDLCGRADAGSLVARWQAAVDAVGYRAVADAQDWKVLRGNADALASVAGYVVKGEYRERESAMPRDARSVAMEGTRGDLKSARQLGSRTPFEILGDIVASVVDTGEIPADDLALWEEWEAVSKGRRQQIWSRGMRDRLSLGEELTDEEAAAVEVEGVDMIAIPSDEWARLCRDPEGHSGLIAAVEQAGSVVSGRVAAADYLSRRGIKFRILFPEVE